MRNARSIILLATFAALLWVAGCSDDPSSPSSNQTDISAADAETYATSALDMVNTMAMDIPDLAAGDFGTMKARKNYGEPVWDPVEMAWVYDYEDEFSEGDPITSWSEIRIHVWIQFRNAEGPLPTALGATVMEYRVSDGMTLHSVSDEGTADLAYDMATTMVVAYTDGGHTVVGSGASCIDASIVADGRSETLNLDMGWNADLAIPLGGCPTGTADVTVGAYRLDAVYDGTAIATWTLTGPNYSASGTEQLYCGLAR